MQDCVNGGGHQQNPCWLNKQNKRRFGTLQFKGVAWMPQEERLFKKQAQWLFEGVRVA
jgi:hypothetical protein